MSVSVTTRPMRPGEREGIDYHFASPEEFEHLVAEEALLEHATVFGHAYGTPRRYVTAALDKGTDVLFDIDWQGTRQLSRCCREDLVSVFILPPSMDELERRLRMRAQDSEETVRYRMNKAADEMTHWQEYDYVVINRDLDSTLQQITHILRAERQRPHTPDQSARFRGHALPRLGALAVPAEALMGRQQSAEFLQVQRFRPPFAIDPRL